MPGGEREKRAPAVRFAHDSERRLAALFEFHGIAWEYEPVEFALAWDGDGRPIAGFRPDFYLPEHELFIELTTLQQRLVTKKNRKLRRLRELHPGIRIEILYRRDFLDLAVTNRIPFLTAPPAERSA